MHFGELLSADLSQAGGNLGPSILKALDTDPQFTVSVLARQSSTSTCPSHIKVYRIPDSYPEDDLSVAFQGQDAVVCSLNPGNIIQQLKFIDAAVEAGVKWFVPAEFGGNKEAAQHGEKMPLHEAKELVNARLVEAEKSGLSWTAVATGPFIDWCAKLMSHVMALKSTSSSSQGHFKWISRIRLEGAPS